MSRFQTAPTPLLRSLRPLSLSEVCRLREGLLPASAGFRQSDVTTSGLTPRLEEVAPGGSGGMETRITWPRGMASRLHVREIIGGVGDAGPSGRRGVLSHTAAQR